MSTSNARFGCLAVAVASILAVAAPTPAHAQQQVRLGEGQTLTISGFISSTLFMNSGLFDGFGQGQSAEWAAVPAAQPTTDKTFLDGEVRNTRINFTFTGQPVLGKFAPRAVLESDFFGTTGGPPFGDEQPNLRIRLAYVDLTNGRTTLRIGQFWSPLFGAVPVSLTHVAFPLGYGATGMIGWRYPGIFLYHDLTPGKPTVIQLQVALLEGSGPSVGTVGSGEASGKPQLEGRLNFTKRGRGLSWTGYVVGHIDWKDTTAVGVAGDELTGSGFEAGGNVTSGKLTVQGNVYTGKAIGHQFAHITQQGDVKGWGMWVQGGYDFTPRWGAWLYYGMDDPDEDDSPSLVTPFRIKNEDIAGMLRFRAGRYALGLEYFRANTTWDTGKADASQVAASVMYSF